MSRSDADDVAAVVGRINRAWLDGRPEEVAPLLHPDAVMAFPGFSGRAEGRDALVAGFVDFCREATLIAYDEADHRVDVAGDTAVATYTYAMVYERSGDRFRASGRDLWAFTRQDGGWLATWRTMLDLAEEPV